MIIYWPTVEQYVDLTKDNTLLFEALLKRTPNLRSFSLNTSQVGQWESGTSLMFDTCLDVLSNASPSLESLWLKHFEFDTEYGERERLKICEEMPSLWVHIPRMHSLKFLSIRSWNCAGFLNSEQHPPPQLKTIKLDLRWCIDKQTVTWLLNPQRGFGLQSLSATIRYNYKNLAGESLQECLPGLESLRRCMIDDINRRWRHYYMDDIYFRILLHDLLQNSEKLVSLDLVVLTEGKLISSQSKFPPTLEQLAIHFFGGGLQRHLYPPEPSVKFERKKHRKFRQDLKNLLQSLPRLQRLVLMESPKLSARAIEHWDWGGFIPHMNDTAQSPLRDSIPEDLIELCNKQGIEIIFPENVFNCEWEMLSR